MVSFSVSDQDLGVCWIRIVFVIDLKSFRAVKGKNRLTTPKKNVLRPQGGSDSAIMVGNTFLMWLQLY